MDQVHADMGPGSGRVSNYSYCFSAISVLHELATSEQVL